MAEFTSRRHTERDSAFPATSPGFRAMRVRMKSELWDALKLDDPERYNLALCCFYLGKGVEETRDLLNRDNSDSEVLYTLETAVYSGLNLSTDTITRSK